MELALNGWLYFPINESLNHDLAIRRFCPARMEQEQDGSQSQLQYWEEDDEEVSEIDLHSPSPSEVDQFVDSFINMDHEGRENNRREFSPVADEFDYSGYGDIDILQDITGSIEELERQAAAEQPVPELAVSYGVDQGLQLVHLLLACAEAVGCRDTRLAESMLAQIWPSVSPLGNSLQRVAYCFAVGLKSRLSLVHNSTNGLSSDNSTPSVSVLKEEKMEAFHLLHQATPYIAFGFMAANEAICRAAGGHESLHIVDLGMQHTLQWPSLFRALGTRPEGPPKKVRITAVTTDQSLPFLKANMKSLAEEANSAGISQLEFQTVTDPASPEVFAKEKLNLREGEALFVNSIMQLHQYVKESRGSLKAILQAIRKLGPTLVTVVEQDANHNGPFFLGRFLESLHYYSAIFDSLEASLPRGSWQRAKIEGTHFAEEIRNIVACEGAERTERHERADQWRRQLGRAGFQAAAAAVKGTWGHSQARMTMMVSVYGCEGYTVGSDKGCLLLGWKGRPIMLASAWQVPTQNNHQSQAQPRSASAQPVS